MLTRLRRFVESILYAGLKPRSPGQPAEERRRGLLNALWEPIERFISGGPTPSDPLYLSNRTWGQKVKLALVIAIPCVLLAGGLALGFSSVFKPKSAPPRELTPSELNAKLLPDIEKTLKIDTFHDADLTQIEVDRTGAPTLKGVLKNNTGHVLSVEFTVDLTDRQGSRLGAVKERVLNVSPQSSTPFQYPLPEPDAAFALVREMHAVPAAQ